MFDTVKNFIYKILYILILGLNWDFHMKSARKNKSKIKVKMKRGKRIKEVKKPSFSDNLPARVDAPTYLPKRRISIQGITPEELLFAYEWADNPKSVKKALLNAGIVGPKDSKRTVEKLEYEFTHNPKVLQAYQEALFNKLESLQITNNRVDSHLGVIAFTDRGLSKDAKGNNIPVHKMPWEVRQCIQEFEERMYYPPKGHPYKKTRIKFYSSVDALRMLRKNNDSDVERAMGMTKAIANNGGMVSINNYNNCGNQIGIHNGDIHNDNSFNLDLTKLDDKELDILFKAIGKQSSKAIEELESKVDEIIEDEILEAQITEIKETAV